jgi:hypothetical protein
VPTGTGHAIRLCRGVEDTQEPMHTSFGVHGLCDYPAIHYSEPVLISDNGEEVTMHAISIQKPQNQDH